MHSKKISTTSWSQKAAGEIRDIHAGSLAAIGGVFLRVTDQSDDFPRYDVEIEVDSNVVGPIYMNAGRYEEAAWKAQDEIMEGLMAAGIKVFDTEEEWFVALNDAKR